MSSSSVRLPESFRFLWATSADDGKPVRYRVARGGRGSAKTHSYARALILKAAEQPLRIGNYREIQKSIRDSVKRVLDDQIAEMGLKDFFASTDSEIRGLNGSLFIFNGLRTNPDAVKSTEGLDLAVVWEANRVSQRSLDLLIPTVRKPGSELWFEYNPEFDTDPVDVMFCGKDGPPPGSIVRTVNYDSNPFFPDVLRQELEWDRKRDPEKYAHIWLGGYQQHSEARVFKNWTVEEFQRPAGTVFRLGADWGYSIDPSVLIRCDIEGNRLYVSAEAWQIGCEIVNLPELFMSVPQAEKWPITADGSRPETISYMRNHGFPKMLAAVKGAGSVEEGIQFLQSFDIVVHPDCEHLIQELTLYRYKTDPLTGKVLPILEDKNNHCIAEGVLVTCQRGDVPIESVTTDDKVLTRGGWRRVLFAGQTDADRETLLIQTTAGAVRCTPDHEIWTARGFIRADALRYDDELIIAEDWSWSSVLSGMAASIGATPTAATKRIGATFSAALAAARRGCIATFGSTTTARFPMGSTFITRTATPGTTTLQTWSCSPAPNTLRSIHGARSAKPTSGRYLSGSVRSQRRGTPARRALQSIARLGQWLMQPSSPRKSAVSSVESGLRRERSETSIVFAPPPAKRPSDGIRALTTKLAYAWSVALHSLRTNIRPKRLVRGRVEMLSAAEPCARVYDLTVEEHHEFFANGVLVSNCIDALRYACEGARRAGKPKPSTPRKDRPRPRPLGWMAG